MVKLQHIENALLYIEPIEEKKYTSIEEYSWLKELLENAKTGAGRIINGEYEYKIQWEFISVVAV